MTNNEDPLTEATAKLMVNGQDVQVDDAIEDVGTAGWKLLGGAAHIDTFSRWVVRDATIAAVAARAPATGWVAQHKAILVHLAAAAACLAPARGPAATSAAISWLTGLTTCIGHWSTRLRASSASGWVSPPALLSVGQWARDEGLWVAHALRAWRGADAALQAALHKAETAVIEALGAARAVVAARVC